MSCMLTSRRHMFFVLPDFKVQIEGAVDEYGDSFARDTTVGELQEVIQQVSICEWMSADDVVDS